MPVDFLAADDLSLFLRFDDFLVSETPALTADFQRPVEVPMDFDLRPRVARVRYPCVPVASSGCGS